MNEAMALTLYYHPFASFCQKALIALYELGTPFEPHLIDLGDPASRAELAQLWPMARFPVLRDDARDVVVPESSLVIAYLDSLYPGPVKLVPADPDEALRVHLLDRLIDNDIALQVTKVVTDTFRPEGGHDPVGVEHARVQIAKAYAVLEDRIGDSGWATGAGFTLADCAAAPALFYANVVVPFGAHRRLAGYFERLLSRPSFARVVEEARPYRGLFPLEWPASY
jgi:glutathione S-transferase